MSEQERERHATRSDEPEVEGHRTKLYGDEASEAEEAERKRKATDEEPDVEAHRQHL